MPPLLLRGTGDSDSSNSNSNSSLDSHSCGSSSSDGEQFLQQGGRPFPTNTATRFYPLAAGSGALQRTLRGPATVLPAHTTATVDQQRQEQRSATVGDGTEEEERQPMLTRRASASWFAGAGHSLALHGPLPPGEPVSPTVLEGLGIRPGGGSSSAAVAAPTHKAEESTTLAGRKSKSGKGRRCCSLVREFLGDWIACLTFRGKCWFIWVILGGLILTGGLIWHLLQVGPERDLSETTCEITSTDFQSFVYTSLCFSDTNTPAHWVSTTNYDITLMVKYQAGSETFNTTACNFGPLCYTVSDDQCYKVLCSGLPSSGTCRRLVSPNLELIGRFKAGKSFPCWFSKSNRTYATLMYPFTSNPWPLVVVAVGCLVTFYGLVALTSYIVEKRRRDRSVAGYEALVNGPSALSARKNRYEEEACQVDGSVQFVNGASAVKSKSRKGKLR